MICTPLVVELTEDFAGEVAGSTMLAVGGYATLEADLAGHKIAGAWLLCVNPRGEFKWIALRYVKAPTTEGIIPVRAGAPVPPGGY